MFDPQTVTTIAEARCALCGALVADAMPPSNPAETLRTCRSADCRSAALLVPASDGPHRELALRTQRLCVRRRRKQRQRAERRIAWAREVRALQRAAVRRRLQSQDEAWRDGSGEVLDIPLLDDRFVPLPAARREAFLAHVREVAARAARASADTASECASADKEAHRLASTRQRFARLPQLRAVSDALCTLCRGGCCTSGENRAYLTVATARRVLATHADWTPNGLIDAWATYLPSRHVAGSCVYHAAAGCALPRALRSDTCNGFYCGSLLRLHERADGEGQVPPVAALQRRGDLWERFHQERDLAVRRVALVDDGGVTEPQWRPDTLPLPDPPALD